MDSERPKTARDEILESAAANRPTFDAQRDNESIIDATLRLLGNAESSAQHPGAAGKPAVRISDRGAELLGRFPGESATVSTDPTDGPADVDRAEPPNRNPELNLGDGDVGVAADRAVQPDASSSEPDATAQGPRAASDETRWTFDSSPNDETGSEWDQSGNASPAAPRATEWSGANLLAAPPNQPDPPSDLVEIDDLNSGSPDAANAPAVDSSSSLAPVSAPSRQQLIGAASPHAGSGTAATPESQPAAPHEAPVGRLPPYPILSVSLENVDREVHSELDEFSRRLNGLAAAIAKQQVDDYEFRAFAQRRALDWQP